MDQQFIQSQLGEAASLLQQFIADQNNLAAIAAAAELLVTSFKQGGKVISCGNGGSHCDAMHFAEELTGKFRNERKSLAAIAISDPAYITCTANDYGFEKIFSRFIEGIGKEGDILLAISTSGNSANVIEAVKIAKEKKMPVIALTGMDGGKLAALVDVEIRAPHSKFSDRAQEIHIKVIHTLIKHIEQTVLQQS